TVQAFKADLLQHLEDEETRLFPMLETGNSEEISKLIQGLNEDHLNVAAVLEQFRELTNSYTLPEDACGTWKSLWWNLQKLESDLKRHIHLENNVLFPRFTQQ
ncbi:MAG TPA: iron-sulfur cluster repair di-iron protein, partial [Bacteroidetes bacterium]|nr:iron-sulfur cluster repair di-iron protein [Bacteroidota bacterium]HEX04964.1 iron-sulfur cluster repair di-iron protein [Bacteroidota bacterium]